MNRNTFRVWQVSLGLMASLSLAHFALAQSGTRSGGTNPGSGTREPSRPVQPQETFDSKLWNWMASVQYRNWAPLPGTPGDAFPGEQPHGAMVKIYANRTAAANPGKLPHGSLIIKENFQQDGATLMAITVMYRSEGYHPEGGDWYWAKYEPNGQISRMNGMPIAGKVGMCIDCHGSAGGNDFSFANDQ